MKDRTSAVSARVCPRSAPLRRRTMACATNRSTRIFIDLRVHATAQRAMRKRARSSGARIGGQYLREPFDAPPDNFVRCGGDDISLNAGPPRALSCVVTTRLGRTRPVLE